MNLPPPCLNVHCTWWCKICVFGLSRSTGVPSEPNLIVLVSSDQTARLRFSGTHSAYFSRNPNPCFSFSTQKTFFQFFFAFTSLLRSSRRVVSGCMCASRVLECLRAVSPAASILFAHDEVNVHCSPPAN